MRLPAVVLAKMAAAGKRRPSISGGGLRVRWFQMSLRTLFILTAVCAVAAWFWQPLAAWAQDIWEIWFPSQIAEPCGPCGMG